MTTTDEIIAAWSEWIKGDNYGPAAFALEMVRRAYDECERIATTHSDKQHDEETDCWKVIAKDIREAKP